MKWFARILANQVARRIAAALVALAAVALFGTSKAHAAMDQGEAYQHTQNQANLTNCPANTVSVEKSGAVIHQEFEKTYGQYYKCNNPFGGYDFGHITASYTNTCADRNGQGTLADSLDYREAPYMTCAGGCKIQGTFGTTTPAGGVTFTTMTDRTWNGDVCSKPGPPSTDPVGEIAEEKKPKPPECVAIGGGQTGCVKPNGDYCATASTGKTFCWTPGQTGTQTNATDAQVKSPVDAPVKKPDVLIPDTDWQRTNGHQVTTTTGSTTTNHNVTNFTQVPGADSANNSTGNNTPDGTGNTSGNGKPTGSDGGEEEGEGNSASGGECGTPYVCSGDQIMCATLQETHKVRCENSAFRKGFTDEINNGDTSDGTEVVDGDTIWAADESGDIDLDTSGLGYGSSCPTPPEVFGQTLNWDELCTMMGMVGLLILAVGHVHALYIFMGD